MKATTTALCLLLVGVALGSWAFVALNPLNQFVSYEDGKTIIRGGTFSGAFLNYLQNGPQPVNDTMQYIPVPDGYGTIHLKAVSLWVAPRPEVQFKAPNLTPILSQLFSVPQAIVDILRGSLRWFLNLWSFNAGAVAKTWDNGGANTNWNTAANWDLDTLPVAADTVTFDTGDTAVTVNIATPALGSFTATAAYANTITVTIAQTASWGTVTVNGGTLSTNGFAATFGSYISGAAGTLTAGASTITVNGNWNFSGGTFTPGTSTVVIAAADTITSPAGAGYTGLQFYNLTVNVSIVATLASDISTGNVLTVNGTLTGNFTIFVNGSNANLLVVGAGAAFGGALQNLVLNGSENYNIPLFAGYPALFTSATGDATPPTVITVQGNITTAGIWHCNVSGANNAATVNFTTANATVNGTGISQIGGSVDCDISFTSGNYTNAGALVELSGGGPSISFTSGAMSITGNVFISPSASFSFGSGSHTLSGSWENNTTQATWAAGTGTVNFTSATGGTMTFAGTNLAESEFNNVTFASSAVAQQTFTMALRGIRANALGTSTITVNSDTILAKATFTLAATGLTIGPTGTNGLTSTSGAVTIDNGGVNVSNAASFIDMGSEAWTVNGPWTNSTTSASWDAGTGSISFGSTGPETMTFAGINLAEVEFNNVTFSSEGGNTFTLATRGVNIGGTLTITAVAPDLTVNTSGQTVDVNGAFTLSGTANYTVGAGRTNVAGDFTKSGTGTLTSGTGTFAFDGASNQSIAANGTTFNTVLLQGGGSKTFTQNFRTGTVTHDSGVTWAITSPITYTITSGVTLTVRGTLTWAPSSGLIIIRSTGTTWFLDSSTLQRVSFVDVSNSSATNVQVDDCNGGLDSGGNNGWWFPGTVECGEGIVTRRPPPPSGLDPFLLASIAFFRLYWWMFILILVFAIFVAAMRAARLRAS